MESNTARSAYVWLAWLRTEAIKPSSSVPKTLYFCHVFQTCALALCWASDPIYWEKVTVNKRYLITYLPPPWRDLAQRCLAFLLLFPCPRTSCFSFQHHWQTEDGYAAETMWIQVFPFLSQLTLKKKVTFKLQDPISSRIYTPEY